MTGPEWAYPPGDAGSTTLLDDLLAATDTGTRSDLLDELGRCVRSFDGRERFAATADNLTRADGQTVFLRPLLEGVEPLDGEASNARVMWHLAWALVAAGALGTDDPDRSVDEHALALAGQAGLPVSEQDLDRFVHHEAQAQASVTAGEAAAIERDLREMGTTTARVAAASGQLGPDAQRRALTVAYDELVALRRDLDAAERDAVELEANRALAKSLGEQLERDEWIRARLRATKSTRPARAIIAARRRLLGREEAE